MGDEEGVKRWGICEWIDFVSEIYGRKRSFSHDSDRPIRRGACAPKEEIEKRSKPKQEAVGVESGCVGFWGGGGRRGRNVFCQLGLVDRMALQDERRKKESECEKRKKKSVKVVFLSDLENYRRSITALPG